MTVARLATAEDLPSLSVTLAVAFEEYPWTSWTVAADDHGRRLAELFAMDVREFALEYGEVWVAQDCSAVAVWIPLGLAESGGEGPPEDVEVSLDRKREALIGDRLPQWREAGALVGAHRPVTPNWYLAALGVHPAEQGKGLGSLVLAPMLQRCDRERLPAYTETSTHRNVGFYRRHGFEVIEELDVPGGGPPVWLMWREPR